MPKHGKMKAGKSAGLEIASMILSLVTMLGEGGAVMIPGLKAAAHAGIRVLEVAQTLESNKAEGLAVAERTYELIEAIMDSLKGRREEDLDTTLLRDLERFQTDLVGVLQILESISKPKLVEKIYKNRMHSEELVRCKEKLDHSFMRFMVYSSIAVRLQVHKDKQDQEQNIPKVEAVNTVPFNEPYLSRSDEGSVYLERPLADERTYRPSASKIRLRWHLSQTMENPDSTKDLLTKLPAL